MSSAYTSRTAVLNRSRSGPTGGRFRTNRRTFVRSGSMKTCFLLSVELLCATSVHAERAVVKPR
nr:MAG TPA: hypothetical protein [Caudoviricetes sp.]